MDAFPELVGKLVLVVTLEGRSIVGTLRGTDAVWNLVLENAHERLFSAERGMETDPLGLYLVRGDALCVAGRRAGRARARGRVRARCG